MRQIKSDRLKKLEGELHDLEEWLKLGLVPKKDVTKHKEEIQTVQAKIEEEKERLQFLKESGDVEEYITPKRSQPRTAYTEMPTIPDIDIGESSAAINESGFEMETEMMEAEPSETEEREEGGAEEDEETRVEEEEDSYFSDRNRWRRGGIIDPDADEW